MRLALLGDPVAHSLSPLLHATALAEVGIPGEYTARRVDAAGLAAAVAELRSGALDGANVTMPHKEAAAALCDRLAGSARRIGAVNTLVRVGSEVVGHTTDVDGVRLAWEWGGLPNDVPILILGGGGAAAAAYVACDQRPIFVSTRRSERAEAFIARLGGTATVAPWGSGISSSVVVNATPLGMHGEPVPDGVLAEAVGLLDMAYGAGTTPSVAAMSQRGLPVVDGLRMLLGQAVAAFRLWTGRRAPLAAMREAVRGAESDAMGITA